ncbi:3-hydroxyacyl-CoA dehydrogenase [Metarhizobium album]|uniref:3-hydroxyacyl-CoA dehydrogenase n=1 Tax=Metarhizobium album TaxID=2182425 RepID=A0A2U2DR80_9HYPH|nr:3-hydroxyacyl-CoA dehydrogenase [Rhizobium album]PWE55807.1 3-hydroxyacyl-CoA dehydrogenase [Rhizobium album]
MSGDIRSIGIVGAGLVGSGWSIVFARAGLDVTIFDPNEAIRTKVKGHIETGLKDLQAAGLVDDPAAVLDRISVVDQLEAAVSQADYVQESVFERVDVKTEVSLAIDKVMGPKTIVGSSSSGIPASAFTEQCANRARFMVSHPVNPPHLVPVVEIVPAPWTDAGAVAAVDALMTGVGQVPVLVRREIEGFILNRLQGALLNEAWALFEEGYASAADIDKTVSYGLGLRWSFMGPFETIDLNAPGGVKDYAERLGPLYHGIAQSRTAPRPWSADLIADVTAERRAALPAEDLAGRRDWRDAYLTRLAAFRKRQEEGK